MTPAFIKVLDLYDYVESMVTATALSTPQSPVLKAHIQVNFPVAVRSRDAFMSRAQKKGSGASNRSSDEPGLESAPYCERSSLLDALFNMREQDFLKVVAVLDLPESE